MLLEECLKNLFSAPAQKSSLREVKKTAENMGILPLKFKAVHIAGTNGKGTTAGLLAAIFKTSGLKTGLFTSPHINTPLERIQINGANIAEKDFIEAVEFVRRNQTSRLNFFEVLTLSALYYFTKKESDIAVLECGIGGLLDSTNIITPTLCMITSVSLDHCALLGHSVKEIASQKSGIIKRGVPVLTGRLSTQAFSVVKKQAELLNAPLLKVSKIKKTEQDFKRLNSVFCFEGETFSTRLLGEAQNQNAALAVKAAEVLGISRETAKKACLEFSVPCRFDVCKITPRKYLIKDGAHNPAAFKEFIKTYRESPFYSDKNTLLLACSKSHDAPTICRLAEKSFNNIILTSADKERNIPPQDLIKYFNKNRKITVLTDIYSLNNKNISGNIIALGSFYLAAALKDIFPLGRTAK